MKRRYFPYFTKQNTPFNNLVACCTDEAALMMVKNKGFNTWLKEKTPHCLVFLCMTHRQALASKHLLMMSWMKTVVKPRDTLIPIPVSVSGLISNSCTRKNTLDTKDRYLTSSNWQNFLRTEEIKRPSISLFYWTEMKNENRVSSAFNPLESHLCFLELQKLLLN